MIDFKIGENRYKARILINFLYEFNLISDETFSHTTTYDRFLKKKWTSEGFWAIGGMGDYKPIQDIKQRARLRIFILKLNGYTTTGR